MVKYLSNERIIELEKQHLTYIANALKKSLGSLLTQLTNQTSITENLNEKNTKNKIDHSFEKIISQIIANHLNWNICSQSGSSDDCYETGNAIVNIDEKTYLVSEGNSINVEKNQTTYVSGEILEIGRGKNKWEPNLSPYVQHKIFGYIPNLTYVVRVQYNSTEEDPLVIVSVDLICLPHAQLADMLGREKILSAGKTKLADGSNKNIRFNPDKLAELQPWRVETIFKRVCTPIEE